MKSAKSSRQQYGGNERKTGKRSEKGAKLDRKSSRGMIYENEELRLRTININAEVERGQSDIKRLRRENEQLRREIWTLRDECDRLNKRFKAKLIDHDHGGCGARGSGGSGGCTRRGSGGGCDGIHSNSNSEDSDSCDTCRAEDDHCSDDCCANGSCNQLSPKEQAMEEEYTQINTTETTASNGGNASTSMTNSDMPQLHTTFDHLSVVSEETLSNSEMLANQNENLLRYTPDLNGPPSAVSLIGPLTPLTPIELVANQLNDLQAVVPPLSYFENILQQHMGSNIGNTPESNTTTSTGTTVRHTNGWDYNIQSPFAQRRFANNSSSSSSASRSPSMQQPQQQRLHGQQLTTFVPTTLSPPLITNTEEYTDEVTRQTQSNLPPSATAIETVAITTKPTNVPPILNSPKHFFAPLKPRLKINTSLANKNVLTTATTTVPFPVAATVTTATTNSTCNAEHQNCEPPDILVANGLASPYQRQVLHALPTTTTTNITPPPIPQRIYSPQTDSMDLDTVLNNINALSEDILARQCEKNRSRENILQSPTTTEAGVHISPTPTNGTLRREDKNKKPYRSEMNLMLTYDGTNSTITPTTTAIGTQTSVTRQNTVGHIRARSLEREHTDSPSPNLPDPMTPFPDNRAYIGFEQYNNSVNTTATGNTPKVPKPPLPPNTTTSSTDAAKPVTPVKPPPPIPPARIIPPALNLRNIGATRLPITNSPLQPSTDPQITPHASPVHGLLPNKSQLYASIAHAAAKRAQFRSAPTYMTRSLDHDLPAENDELLSPTVAINETTQSAEMSKRKPRRVSIVCNDSNTDPGVSQTPTKPAAQTINIAVNAETATGVPTIISPTAASCNDLTTAGLTVPMIKNLKQTSQSTPNSPHSSRRYTNGSSIVDAATAATAGASNATTTNQHNHPHQQQRKSSQDSTRDLATAAAAIVARNKCSRRHSDGTVNSNVQRHSGASGHHSHHHHHHHHHQHTSSVISSHPHHSHHSRQDSNHDSCTSISDRNSNSFPSSRESSTSFSMRSQRRKISVSSHAGGKIPWCGCWGNGCL
ncbi:mucin-5AC isoform X4 [Teleopsis dalmanni]|uniref:mucin-5AC isoform X4 n=1 Tax=Teleopsis dalmanni TaxID=139649 RepID=UPI0018CC8876|nr:mucin-5AC isoform X4 [Teleopsis dalmanni]